jgi:hypothetical protein
MDFKQLVPRYRLITKRNIMNAQELRIGNYVTINNSSWSELKNNPLIVSRIQVENDRLFPDSKGSVKVCDSLGAEYNQFDEFIEPIPLTPEWLERAGFKYTQSKGYGGQDMWAGMGFISDGKVNFRGNPNHLHLEGYFNTQIKYVHKLQNLYFALTGKELTFK